MKDASGALAVRSVLCQQQWDRSIAVRDFSAAKGCVARCSQNARNVGASGGDFDLGRNLFLGALAILD
jgi:hypothetical protein